MSAKITFKGAPMTLVGRSLKVGEPAGDFRVTGLQLQELRLADFKDKIKVITFFPSIDTPVCDLQVKEFNRAATKISSDIIILGISKDLPFAQKRFCDTFAINNVVLASDYKTSSFGINYGLLIKELNLLARGVLILDKADTLRYLQIVPELTQPVNYQEALEKLEDILKNPALAVKSELPEHCQPCEGAVASLPKERIDLLLAKSRGWELVEGKKLVKEVKFKDFSEAKFFLDLLSLIAEEQGHHPSLVLTYGKVRITLTTHAAAGLTENDFIMARVIDSLGGGK